MGKAVEKKKKKKGRPSLLDLQKRSLQEEQTRHSHGSDDDDDDNSAPGQPQKNNHGTPATAITQQRRSTRRNPASSSPDEREEGGSSPERRGREKQLKLVLRAPNSGGEEDAGESQSHRKRKIAAIGDGSGGGAGGEKGEKTAKPASTQQGSQLGSEASAPPLPDKKLLLFVLERLQKKDTYGVFSEPVDPEELPDYHDIIENPMDFGTLRKKLDGGAYTSLDQFENDVFLICSNAMQYNAPDTVYFRQARSIQELARKNFSNLRQESDVNEPEPKVVRRGRPPTKHLKRPPGRPPLDRTGASDATLATGGENSMSASFNLRKGPFSADKLGLMRNNNAYSLENRFERNGDYAGSSSKANLMKFGKHQPVPEENRRNTYKHPSSSGREPSLLATIDQGRKQLMAVALQADHGYARSLARFASNLGPAAWEVASRMIEKALPGGTKFGPGWIIEDDFLPPRRFQLSSPAPSSLWPFSLPGSSGPKGTDHSALEPKDNSAENVEGERFNRPERQPPPVISSEPVPPSAQSTSKETEAVEGSKSIKPPSKIHSNGFTGPFGYSNNLTTAHMGKMTGDKHSSGYHSRPPVSPEAEPTAYTNSRHREDPHISRNNSGPGRSPLSQQKPELGAPHQRRPGSAPPDLNIRFHSPGSPNSARADSAHPDLALQL